MKKILFTTLCAVAAVTLASCSNDEVIGESPINSNEIRFNVVANGATRSADNYCNTGIPKYVSVYAYSNYVLYTEKVEDGEDVLHYSFGTYIDGDKLQDQGADAGADAYTKANHNWVNLSGTRMWPSNDDAVLDFFAFVNLPYTGDTGENIYDYSLTDGWSLILNNNCKLFSEVDAINGKLKELVFANYEVAENSNDQRDLMYAITPEVYRGNTVNLNFRHALSQIGFRVWNRSKSLYVEVSEISLCNVLTKSDVHFGRPQPEDENGLTGTAGNIDIHHGSTVTSSVQCYWHNMYNDIPYQSKTLFDDLYINQLGNCSFTLSTEPKWKGFLYKDSNEQLGKGDDFSNTDSRATNSKDVAYMIPQTFDPWLPTADQDASGNTKTIAGAIKNNHSYVKIKCKLYNVASEDGVYDSTRDLQIFGGTDGAYIYLPTPSRTLEPGIKYYFDFQFGTGGGNGSYTEDGSDTLVEISYTVQTGDISNGGNSEL